MPSNGDLPQEVVLKVLKLLAPETGAFLVGGQALNFWADYYRPHCPELEALAPFTSRDIDFRGTRGAAEKLARVLGGSVQTPGPFSGSPNSAVVQAEVMGHEVIIDFMNCVLGVPNPWVTEIGLPFAAQDGTTSLIPMEIMHPLDCLRSKVKNARSLGRRDPGAQRQLAAAPLALREHLSQMIAQGFKRETNVCLRALTHYLVHDVDGKFAHRETPNDPADILRRFQDDLRIDERYRTHQISWMVNEVDHCRQRLG